MAFLLVRMALAWMTSLTLFVTILLTELCQHELTQSNVHATPSIVLGGREPLDLPNETKMGV
jgi:hypothetical protein